MEGLGVLFLAFFVLILVFLFFSFIPVGLWISAWAAGVRVPLITLVAMRLRRVPPAKIIYPLIKATKVDGVYEEDPMVNPNARKFDKLTYIEALNLRVKVLDSTALSLCMDHNLPIIVLDLWQPDSLERAVRGEPVGTLIDG